MRKKLFIFSIISVIFGSVCNLSAQTPEIKLPAFVKNSAEDLNVNKDASLQFTLTKDGKLFFKETLITPQNFSKTIKEHFENKIPVRHAFIKMDVEAKAGNLLKLMDDLFKTAEVFDIRLVVIPYKLVVIPSENVQENLERRGDGYTLNLRVSSLAIEQQIEDSQKRAMTEISDDDEPPPPIVGKDKPLPKTPARSSEKPIPIIIGQTGYNKMTLNGMPKSEKELLTLVEKQFKERESKGIYRFGTNEIDKSVYLKLSPNLEYKYLIGLLDGLYGIGANRIHLRVDEVAR